MNNSVADLNSAVVSATRALGLAIVASNASDNAVISPASAVIALSMLGSGASGLAEEQLAPLLGASGEDRDQQVKALVASLAQYSFGSDLEAFDPEVLPEAPQVHLANQVAIDDSAQVEQPYLDRLTTWFDAGILHADLGSSEGKTALDEWVKRNTGGLIPESAVEPADDLRLVLQNAVLLAARWELQFSANATVNRSFTKADGASVEAQFMHASWTVPYSEVEQWKMIELRYAGKGDVGEHLVARFVLPPIGAAISEVTPDLLARLESTLSNDARVEIAMPKLDLTSTVLLTQLLKNLGLTSVFSCYNEALRHISTAEDLYVSEVVQQGRVRLDEDGTVAAAVTEIAIRAMAMPFEPEKSFIADRPYLVIIQDDAVKWDLFQILVNEP